MSNHLKKLAGDTALYGLSSLVGRFINFLLVPLYTALFTKAEYGVIIELYVYIIFLNIIYTYGMETAYFRFANKIDENLAYRQSLSAIIVTSIIFSGILVIFSSPLAFLLQYPGKQNYIVWIALILATDAIVAIPFARLRQQKKALQFALAKLFNIFITVGLNLFFLVFCKDIFNGKYLENLKPVINQIYNPNLGVGYILLSNLIANLCFFLFLWKSFRDFRFVLNKNILKPILNYAYPLIFMGIAGTLNNAIDKILLKYYMPESVYLNQTNEEALGVYGACSKLAVFMMLAIQAFKYASEPFFFARAQDKDSPQMYANVMKWFIICSTFLFLVISLNLDILKNMFLRKPEYHEGIMVVPILLMANLFLGIYYNLSIWFKLKDKTQYSTWITVLGTFVTLVANFFLIPYFGYMGAAVATLLCYLVMAFVCYQLGNKYFYIPYEKKSALLYLGLAITLVVFSQWLHIQNQLYAFLFNFLLLLVYILSVIFYEKLPWKKLILRR